ncbi:MAG: hypothetical protein KF832_20715 [Caldilineaceae bacterium]|nr:hypothetical protein [Caldilineaceae bacterium]
MAVENNSDFDEMMEFTEMKVIWDSQNEEKLYAINEDALYEQIKRKGKAVGRLLRRFEVVIIGINVLTAVVLLVTALINDTGAFYYLTPVLYLAYALVALVWRRNRRQQDLHFMPTMLGELDKAIWQINYLISRSRELIFIYMLPMALLFTGKLLYDGQPYLALAMLLLMGGACFVTDRWEIKRCYEPQKESLESLRATLTAAEA